MITSLLDILIILAIALTTIVLALGLFNLVSTRAGRENRATLLMAMRVGFQGLAVLLIVILYMVKS